MILEYNMYWIYWQLRKERTKKVTPNLCFLQNAKQKSQASIKTLCHQIQINHTMLEEMNHKILLSHMFIHNKFNQSEQ